MTQKPKLFIDGEHGTTGLQIRERLAKRADIELLSVPVDARRDGERRRAMLNGADIALLCLPDDASREAVAMIDEAGNRHTRLIDASTAHRAVDGWVFGFAELTSGQRKAIAKARFVSNPGCYSTGAIALLRPLTEAGLLSADYPVTINAISGYTGGGKALIAQMEDKDNEAYISSSYFLYGLNLAHKHLPEICRWGGLSRNPVFTPSVGRFARGMLVSIPLHLDLLTGRPKPDDIREKLVAHYNGARYVDVVSGAETRKAVRIDPEELAGSDRMNLYVFGSADGRQANLVATLDNLGKGASGAAIQNLDIMLGR